MKSLLIYASVCLDFCYWTSCCRLNELTVYKLVYKLVNKSSKCIIQINTFRLCGYKRVSHFHMISLLLFSKTLVFNKEVRSKKKYSWRLVLIVIDYFGAVGCAEKENNLQHVHFRLHVADQLLRI